MPRDYQPVIERVAAQTSEEMDPDRRMQAVVDALWDEFQGDISWVGFYLADETRPEGERLTLGPRRDRPACSPIGLHGVCGAGYMLRATQIIDDVAVLGPKYIACDPDDRSEIVIPVITEGGAVWAVLDLDSHKIGAFDDSDEDGLKLVLEAAGFRAPVSPAVG